MREAGMARRLLQEEIREKRILANCSKRKCVHSGQVRVRMAADALSEREWDRMNGHTYTVVVTNAKAGTDCKLATNFGITGWQASTTGTWTWAFAATH